MIERLRSEPLAWYARNEAAMRRTTARPDLQIYRGLLAVEDQVVEGLVAEVTSTRGGPAWPHFSALEKDELAWLLRLLYQLMLTSVQTSDRMLLLNYVELTARSRFQAGCTPRELTLLLDHLNRSILQALAGRSEVVEARELLHDRIALPFEFAKDEVQEQYDRFAGGPAVRRAAARPAAELTPREMLEQTVWNCLVQRR
jgi:hypothetical protein